MKSTFVISQSVTKVKRGRRATLYCAMRKGPYGPTAQGTQADSVANSLLSSYHDVLGLVVFLLATVASSDLAQTPVRSSQDLSQHRFERRPLLS